MQDTSSKRLPPLYDQACLAGIRSHYPALFEAERKVADYVMHHPQECLGLKTAELASKAGVAPSTVIRFCKGLGYSGFGEFKLSLAKDLVMPMRLHNESLCGDDDIATMASKLFESNIQALVDTSKAVDPGEIARAIDAIVSAERVDIYGSGSSIPMVYDLHYWMSRIGVICNICIDNNIQKILASQSNAKTLSIAISHSGATRNVVEALALAKRNKATTVAITNHIRSPITSVADIVLLTASQNTTLRNVSMTSRVAQLTINDLLVLGVARKRLQHSEEMLKVTAEALVTEKIYRP